MGRYFICFLSLGFTITTAAQTMLDTTKLSPFYRFADFHIHPTYKHYFRYKTAKEMRLILETTKYNRETNTLCFDPDVVKRFRIDNWTKYKTTKKKAVRKGITSTLRNYDQSGYPQIMYTPGSVLCNSYSPYEKQFALKGFKRLISSLVVTGMGLCRLKAYSKNNHTPFRDFLAEYYYNLIQDEEKFIVTSFPDHLFQKDGETYHPGRGYYNIVKMVKDSLELSRYIFQNDQVFQNWKSGDPPPHIITPMVMSIEGGQVLYDTLSARSKYILNPLNYNGKGRFFREIDPITLKKIDNELLNIVDSLRNLPHRLFFITLGHFAQNHVVGFAKTLDRDPENFQHRVLSAITNVPRIRNDIIRKTYAGFNYRDSIGFRIVDSCLNPAGSRYKKPTYIDVKHMDIKARIQYYYMRRLYERTYKTKIPVIASHFAVSGENQALAAATGLWPNFDRYVETEKTFAYYKSQILREEMKKSRGDYWKELMLKDGNKKGEDRLDAFGKSMYKPLNFLNNPTTANEPYDPFTEYDNVPIDSNKNIGWFYPWSINLFDEEIIEINKSDGIIGLLLDPRQQGAYMPNYKSKKYRDSVRVRFNNAIREADIIAALSYYRFEKDEINLIDYHKSEPLLRNLFYIVRLISQQKHVQEYANNPDTLRKYPWFVKDSLDAKKGEWDFVVIGSDYDGLIDPIDYAPTASYIPTLHRRLIIYAYIFSKIHQEEFFDPGNPGPLITSISDSEDKMRKFFYENGKDFIIKYF